MTLDILRRTGGWCVELQQPLKSHTGEITAIEIRPPTAEIVIRWGNYEIESMLALLSRLCDVPERVLRQLPTADFDRVMFAFMNIVGSSIKADIEGNTRPLATPDDALPEPEMVPTLDQRDPRFPDPGSGPVVRLTEKKSSADVPPMNLNPPQVSEAIR